MVFVKKCQFLHSFIVGQTSQENLFHDILKRKNAFLGYKTRSLKSRKMGVFPKGLVHGFGLKVSIFLSFCFRQKRPGKCVSRYSRKKKHLSTLKKQEVQEVENYNFSKGVSPWFWSKIGNFSIFFIYFRRHWPGKCVSRYSRMKKHFCRP